jgi:hypothetical protein
LKDLIKGGLEFMSKLVEFASQWPKMKEMEKFEGLINSIRDLIEEEISNLELIWYNKWKS